MAGTVLLLIANNELDGLFITDNIVKDINKMATLHFITVRFWSHRHPS